MGKGTHNMGQNYIWDVSALTDSKTLSYQPYQCSALLCRDNGKTFKNLPPLAVRMQF